MKTIQEKNEELQKEPVQRVQQEQSAGGDATFVDNRPATSTQRKLRAGIEGTAGTTNPIQRKASPERSAHSAVQGSRRNNTGLPDNLKSGIENLSGYSMDDVKVHYNSGKPAQLQAHAYAQGTDIHLAPGQEKHLPHEAWHVVQQKQGRVQPTRQLKSKVPINDDAGLEKEADVMGKKALQSQTANKLNLVTIQRKSSTVQREEDEESTLVEEGDTLTINLEFAGSGKNEMNNEGGNKDEGWTRLKWEWQWDLQDRRAYYKETEDTAENKKQIIIAGVRAPITKDAGIWRFFEFFNLMSRLFPKIPKIAPNKHWIPRGSFDLGVNKISILKQRIPKLVQQIINDNDNVNKNININIVGHSRGGVAAAYVAKKLMEDNNVDRVTISYIGYDPVPAGSVKSYGDRAIHLADMAWFKNSIDLANDPNKNRSVVIYSVASGVGIPMRMRPKELINSNVIIITSAQHSANKQGYFYEEGGEPLQFSSLTNLENGVYCETLEDTDHGIIGGERERGGDGSYGYIKIEKMNSYNDVETRYDELFEINKTRKDPGRKEVVLHAVSTILPPDNE